MSEPKREWLERVVSHMPRAGDAHVDSYFAVLEMTLLDGFLPEHEKRSPHRDCSEQWVRPEYCPGPQGVKLVGSRAAAGTLGAAELTAADGEGTTLADLITRAGHQADAVAGWPVERR